MTTSSARRRVGLRATACAALCAGWAACVSSPSSRSSGATATDAPPATAPVGDTTSALGSDVSALPARFPHGAWVPIEAPILSMQIVVKVIVNEVVTTATLDTGAMATTMSEPVAAQLGLLREDQQVERIRAIDAHGRHITGARVPLGALSIGPHAWSNVQVTVLGDQPDVFLIGADLLKDVDLYIAADEGLVGMFDAGRGPKSDDDLVVDLERGERQLVVAAIARGARGDVPFRLIVDTGASNTSVPVIVGINGGLPADIEYEATTVSVGGEQVDRGRFVLQPLRLGPQKASVGRVLALPSTMSGGSDVGLLGNDVFMRHHTLISFHDAQLRFRRLPDRPSQRARGPAGAACTDAAGAVIPCIHVALAEPPDSAALSEDDLPGVCLQVDVDRAYAGRTLELAVVAEERDGHLPFSGGALRAFVTVGDEGTHACFRLWRQLERLGLKKDTKLSLRWVRSEGVQWPCDPMKTRCITFTGPMAKLPVK